MTPREIYKQNVIDLTRVCVILGQLLVDKPLTEEENIRVKYCKKTIDTVLEKQNLLDAQQ